MAVAGIIDYRVLCRLAASRFGGCALHDALWKTTAGEARPYRAVGGIAAFNLLVTQRRLKSGARSGHGACAGWSGAELGLPMVLLAVAGMTALNPARNVEAQRQQATAAAAAAAAQAHLVSGATPEMQMVDDLHVMFTVTPGWVGENEFRGGPVHHGRRTHNGRKPDPAAL